MADTRPPGRVAGKARGRAAGLLAAAALASPGLLVPVGTYTGAPLLFLAPVAVAVHGPDLYVADAGRDALLRLDMTTLAVQRMGARHARPGMRLKAEPDGTLYVLDPAAAEFVQLARDGRVLRRLADPALLAGAADFAVERVSGRILILDRGQNRILEVSPGFGAAVQRRLPASGAGATPWTLAAAPGEALYVVDRARREIALVDRDGRRLQAFGAGGLALPGEAALDRYGRLFVHDASDGSLKLFTSGAQVGTLAARELGVAAIAAFALDEDQLAVAAPGAGGIRVFRLLPPQGAR